MATATCRTAVSALLYVGVTLLAAFMASWVLVFPATWRAGDPAHDQVSQRGSPIYCVQLPSPYRSKRLLTGRGGGRRP